MLMSLGVVFFGMQLMMVGPLKGRLDSIQTRLDLSENSMNKLVAARDSVFKTNDMLTVLEDQSGKLEMLQKSISDIQALRQTIQQEADAAIVALAALDRISNVQTRLIATHQQTLQAATQVTAIEDLQKSIVQGSESTEIAANSLDGLVSLQSRMIAASNSYDKASEGISNLTDLAQKVVSQSAGVEEATAKVDELIELKNSVQTAAINIESAQAQVVALGALKNDVLASTTDLPAAQENVRTLVALNENLSGQSLQLTTAQQNLDSLLALQNTLGNQSSQVADAIQNLEIMDDFRVEVATHVKSLDSLRRTLTEIAMMESTLGRVAQVVEPLTQISNLRRLGDEEVREAARVILDRRVTRFSQSTSANGTTVLDQQAPLATTDSTGLSEETPVPLPRDAQK